MEDFVSLTQLLEKYKVSIQALTLAIRKRGIYTLDQVDLPVMADEDDLKIAIELLAAQYLYENDRFTYMLRNDGLALSPLELAQERPRSVGYLDDRGYTFDLLGWPKDLLPDFDNIEQLEAEVDEQPVAKAKRKAPDAFVAALVRLLVEIAKRDPKINVDAMPGIKKDLYAVAIKFDAELECTEMTFDTYIEGFCKFKRGSRRGSYYEELFPEYFK
jgi:hypothetical protein